MPGRDWRRTGQRRKLPISCVRGCPRLRPIRRRRCPADPVVATAPGWPGGAEIFDPGVEFSDLCGEGLVSAGQETEDMFGVGDGGVTITGTKTGTDVHGALGESPEVGV